MKQLKIGDKIVHTDKDGRKHLLKLIKHPDCSTCFFGNGDKYVIGCRNSELINGGCTVRNTNTLSTYGAFILIKSQKLRNDTTL